MKETENRVFEPMPETPAEPETTAAATDDELLAEARKNIRNGLLWCVGGLAASFLSYHFAEAGSRYVVATGAIIWGAIQALRGVGVAVKIRRQRNESDAARRLILSAATVAVLIGGLTYYSIRTMRSNTIDLLDTEQIYTAEGLRIAIPAGYTAISETAEPETDSTYAHSYMYVTDGRWEFNTQRVVGILAPDVECIADISDYCLGRDSAYYDGGIVAPTQPYALGGLDMLCSEGRRTEYPDDIFTNYDFKHGQTLITVGIIYPAEEYGKPETRRRVEELLSGIALEADSAAESQE